jgi:hypothetical protein
MGVFVGLVAGVGGCVVGFVERAFFGSWHRWPFAVATDFGRCFWSKSDVRPGHVAKKPASMAAVQVVVTGLKQARCK